MQKSKCHSLQVTDETTAPVQATSYAHQNLRVTHESQVETKDACVEIQDTDDKILIPHTHSRAQVWDPWVTDALWKQHRIAGQLVGALPRLPHQSAILGLPLSLMSEEVRLLKDEGIGVPVTYKEMKEQVKEEVRVEFQKYVKRCQEEQVDEARNQRKREIELMADKILDGKRKKFEERKRKKEKIIRNMEMKDSEADENVHSEKCELSEEIREGENLSPDDKDQRENCKEEIFTLDREKIIDEEVSKIKDLQENMQVVEVFTQNPLISRIRPEPHPLPAQLEHTLEWIRYAVFRDLWHRGYHMTQGLKFGGDFLAYSGDPHLYHGTFIIRCVEDPNRVSKRDLVAAVRTAAATRKTFVLATVDKNLLGVDSSSVVKYRSYQWAYDD